MEKPTGKKNKTITIRGKIADHNVAAKESLLNVAVPCGVGTLTVYDDRSGQQGRVVPYRTIGVVVQTSPQIAQTKHAKFTLTLYAPSPVWYAANRSTLILGNLEDVTYINDGHYASDYELRIMPTSAIRQMSLYLDGITASSPYLYCDFTKIDPNGVTGNILFSRERGKIRLTVGGVNAISALSPESKLWALPPGEHTLTLSAGATLAGSVSFAPAYAGVVINAL